MKVIARSAFMNSYGLFKKGDVLEVNDKDFDATLMEPAESSGAEETTEEPAKKTAGRKKKA